MKHHSITKHNVPRETFSEIDSLIEKHRQKLRSYLEELLWWNERINLVSRNVSRETVWEHIRHSLLLSRLEVFKSADTIIDSGTGGGLPGIPLAIIHPQKHILLNDLVSKKCLAVKQIVKKMGFENIGIIDGLIEKLRQDKPFLLISKHAFKVNDLYQMTEHLPWSSMVFYKGKDIEKELDGIDDPIVIDLYNLSGGGAFYEGKSIVVVNKG